MMYLSKEELVKNIAEQTERAEAIIKHIDFNSDKFNPNSVIIPFLSNIFSSALIVTALEDSSNAENDCHRNAYELVMRSVRIKNNTKDFIKQINTIKQKYTIENNGNNLFDSDECLDFLNAYDCFMYNFAENSTTLKNLKNRGNIDFRLFSFRNMIEKILKKNLPLQKNNSNLSDSCTYVSELLENILREQKTTNEYLKNISETLIELNNGGNFK